MRAGHHPSGGLQAVTSAVIPQKWASGGASSRSERRPVRFPSGHPAMPRESTEVATEEQAYDTRSLKVTWSPLWNVHVRIMDAPVIMSSADTRGSVLPFASVTPAHVIQPVVARTSSE